MERSTAGGDPGDFRRRVARRFAAAATSYDAHSDIQRQAATRLAGLIATAGLPPRPRVLEIGCGTGHLTALLTHHLPGARIVATDIAPPMVVACRDRLPRLEYLAMDGTRPALRGPVDLVCANFVTQWFPDLPAALRELTCLLAPGGLLALGMLGQDTFCEWRAAYRRLHLKDRVLAFPAAHACLAALPPGEETRIDSERRIARPASALDFVRHLRAIGADTPAPGADGAKGNLRAVLRELGPAPAITYEIHYLRWKNPGVADAQGVSFRR